LILMTDNKENIALPESALAAATDRFITARRGETLEVVEARMRQPTSVFDVSHYIYVLDETSKLIGVFSIRDLLTSPAETLVEEVMASEVVSVPADVDQEIAAHRALQTNVKAVPVTDSKGVLLGVISADTIFHILSQEHSEDMLYSAGAEGMGSVFNISRSSLFTLVWARLPWLVVGLLGGLVAALIVERFESVLEQYIVLAFFLPLVVYMSDAVASQTLTILIRAMAVDPQMSIKRYVWREVLAGFLIAASLSLLMGLIGWLWFSDPVIAWVLAVSLFLAILVATWVALTITLILAKWYKDPAPGSGPFSTIVVDIVTILIYFLVSSYFLTILI